MYTVQGYTRLECLDDYWNTDSRLSLFCHRSRLYVDSTNPITWSIRGKYFVRVERRARTHCSEGAILATRADACETVVVEAVGEVERSKSKKNTPEESRQRQWVELRKALLCAVGHGAPLPLEL